MNTIRLNTIGEVVAKKTSGGAEINNQEKTIDITENGTTEVAPDNGFTGLSKVIINTDVQGGETGGGESGSGGGEGGSGGGSGLKYYKLNMELMSQLSDAQYQAILIELGMIFRNASGIHPSGAVYINCGMPYATLNPSKIRAFVLEDTRYILNGEEEFVVAEDALDIPSLGLISEGVFIPITEEEYYNPATYA